MRRSLLVTMFCTCALTSSPASNLVSAARAQTQDPSRPELIGQNRVRLVGNWRISFERGDDDDFWFVVTQSGVPQRRIHVVRGLVVDIRDSDLINGWTIDVLVKGTSGTDCGNPASNCPPAFIEFNRIGDWTYRLRAEDDPQPIDDTDVIFERLDRPGPVGPAIFSVQTSGLTVSLAWDAFPGATSYQLEAGTAAGLSNIFVGDIGNVTSFQATGPPGTYFVRVRARLAGGLGLSGPSNEVTFTLGACMLLPAPTHLGFTKTGSFLDLSWLGVTGARNYRLLVGTGPQRTDVFNGDVGLVGFLQFDVAAIPMGIYYVRVAAENGCGVGSPSNEVLIPLP
jgi:hypothetical protein